MLVMGFDFGQKRTGVAIANTLTSVATPQSVLYAKQGQPDWEGIANLIHEWQHQQFVVGIPRTLDGSPSSMDKLIRKFCRQLEQRTELPVELADEQLSSREAEQRLKSARQAGRKRKVRKEEIDQLAAAIILENWMQGYEAGMR